MRFKLPLPRKRATQAVLASGAALVGFAGLAFAQVPPALADPTVALVAVGSDTIQDVYNQFAIDLSGNELGSYNAVNPVSQVANENITPVETQVAPSLNNPYNGCSFTRPNGSGAGVKALRESVNPGSTIAAIHGTPAAPQPGCVDIARSSSGVSNGDPTAGAIVWIPFAEDAVGGATGPAAGSGFSTTPYTYNYANGAATGSVTITPTATAITTADSFTKVDLINLYKNGDIVTEGGVTYWPLGSPQAKPAGAQQIDLYVPQLGSGTRNFWASTLGFDPTNLPAWVHDTLTGASSAASASPAVPVEEHNGTPMASDPDAFGPFSIAQWVAQRNGHADRRHTAVVHNLANCTGITETTTGGITTDTGTCTAAVSPFTTGGAATGNLNSAFPVNRYVYSVTSWTRVNNTADPLYNLLNNGSVLNFMCGEVGAILSYGFATIPNATLTNSCGTVSAANRADA
jgi:phosphate transport system substrate-binding protein